MAVILPSFDYCQQWLICRRTKLFCHQALLGARDQSNPFNGTHDPGEPTKLINVLEWFLDATTPGRMIMTTMEAVDYHTAGEPFRIVQPPGDDLG
jgi:hypothetical protein